MTAESIPAGQADVDQPGVVVTFYSYKGGVGRSMALANVAELLVEQGLSVILVDWDLEAPGLERYFFAPPPNEKDAVALERPRPPLERALEAPGLMNLLVAYRDRMSRPTPADDDSLPVPDLDRYLLRVEDDPERELWLLGPGRRDTDEAHRSYVKTVQTFDWTDFYENWEGELFFEWLRKELCRRADVVLIDSRTGITEMGGVCTYHLADIVALFCAPNDQNLEGTAKMVRRFLKPELKELRQGRPLGVVVAPTRIVDSEGAMLTSFMHDFLDEFRQLLAHVGSPGDVEEFWELQIPQIGWYAFRERVAARETKTFALAPRMVDAYSRIVASLAQRAPAASALASLVKPGDLAIVRAQRAYLQLSPHTREVALSLLGSLVTLNPNARGSDVVPLSLPSDVLCEAFDAELVARLTGPLIERNDREEIHLVEPELGTRWPVFAEWIETNRRALLTRARVAAAASLWDEKERSSSNLLTGDLLTDAEGLLKGKRVVRLTPLQLSFVKSSADARQTPAATTASQIVAASTKRRWVAPVGMGIAVAVISTAASLVLRDTTGAKPTPPSVAGEVSGYPADNPRGLVCSGPCCTQLQNGGQFSLSLSAEECRGRQLTLDADGYCGMTWASSMHSVPFVARPKRVSWRLVDEEGVPIPDAVVSSPDISGGYSTDGEGVVTIDVSCALTEIDLTFTTDYLKHTFKPRSFGKEIVDLALPDPPKRNVVRELACPTAFTSTDAVCAPILAAIGLSKKPGVSHDASYSAERLDGGATRHKCSFSTALSASELIALVDEATPDLLRARTLTEVPASALWTIVGPVLRAGSHCNGFVLLNRYGAGSATVTVSAGYTLQCDKKAPIRASLVKQPAECSQLREIGDQACEYSRISATRVGESLSSGELEYVVAGVYDSRKPGSKWRLIERNSHCEIQCQCSN